MLIPEEMQSTPGLRHRVICPRVSVSLKNGFGSESRPVSYSPPPPTYQVDLLKVARGYGGRGILVGVGDGNLGCPRAFWTNRAEAHGQLVLSPVRGPEQLRSSR